MPPQEIIPSNGPDGQSDNDHENFDRTGLNHGTINPAFVHDDTSEGEKNKSDEAPKKSTDDAAPMDFDDLLPYIGEFGRYQKILFLLMIPFAFFVAWVYFSQIFMGLTPEKYWCKVPELMDSNLTIEQRLVLSIPKTDTGFDKCSYYLVNYTEILQSGRMEPDPQWPTVRCTDGWEYEFTDLPYPTIATELNWVCDDAALPNAAQAIFFCGAIVGGLIFGWLADRYGRIPALVCTNLIGGAAGVATAYSKSFWAFSFCRFFVGFSFDNCFVMMYILVLEYVGPKWRTFVANMSIALFFTFAACILPWMAYYIADWRIFTIVTSAPLFLSILTPWIVPESARWLLSQGKVDKAILILKDFERINNTQVDESIYKKFREDSLKQSKAQEAEKSYSVIDLFTRPRLRNITLLFIVIWMAIALVFDGHVRSVGGLGLDMFLTFTIASATELPADTFLTVVLDKWGRRWLACGSMVISGVFSLLATLVPSGVPSATLAIIGRFAVNISYNIGLQYAAEVLPTVVRAQGVTLIHIMGYVAGIVSPFIIYLSSISPTLPLIILGILGIFGGILCLFLPETLDQELPQTLDDGERFGLDQKFWDMPCVRRVEDEEPVERFRRTERVSIRASIRGETYRSSMILRDSIRSRKKEQVASF